MRERRLIGAAGLALALAAGCQPPPVPPGEAAAFAAEVDPIVENALEGLSRNDYAQHSQDFSEEMRDRIDPITFPQVYGEIIGRLGAYRSHTFRQAVEQGDLWAMEYEAAFENDAAVKVTVIFDRDDPEHRILGLWFDSPLLRD